MTDVFDKTTTNTIVRDINHEDKCRWFRKLFILEKRDPSAGGKRRESNELCSIVLLREFRKNQGTILVENTNPYDDHYDRDD